jgi:hypothetical protein
MQHKCILSALDLTALYAVDVCVLVKNALCFTQKDFVQSKWTDICICK